MTVSTELASVTYTGNGSTTDFPIPFKFISNDHIQLTLIVVATGVGTLVAASDYTLSGAGNPAGGSVNYLPGDVVMTSAYRVRIDRVVPITQDLDIFKYGEFDPEAIEKQLDLIVMQVQRIKADLAAAVSGDEITSITQSVAGPTTAVDGNFPAFNGAGGALLEDSGYGPGSFAAANHSHAELASLWTDITKTITQSISSNATLASDADFTFTMEANTVYLVEADLYIFSPISVGYKLGLTGPASPALVLGFGHEIDSAAASATVAVSAYGSLRANTPAANRYVCVKVRARIENGNNAGAFALQFAQNVSSATAMLIYKGSSMKYRKVQ